jgi:hypothetical protein
MLEVALHQALRIALATSGEQPRMQASTHPDLRQMSFP